MPKEEKDPRFPQPPANVGVPQYPTPDVPDFITKIGHIVLVEKHSTEGGGYTPLPLDGSVTYKEADANKWPSPLYLVSERVSQDGKWVIRFWANDRSARSQDVWNYALQFSGEATSFPIYIREYILPRVGYQRLPELTPDSANANALLVKEDMRELPDEDPLRSRYVKVVRVFETLPGPFLTSTRIDFDGMVVTEQRRKNVLANIAVGETLTGSAPNQTWMQITSEPVTDLVGWEVRISRTLVGNVVEDFEEDRETFAVITIQKQLVTNTYTPNTSAGVEDYVKSITKLKSLRITRIINGGTPPSAWDSHELIQYDFPCLVFGASAAFISTLDGNEFGNINLIRNAVRRKYAQSRIHVQYAASPPTPTSWTIVNPQDLIYQGIFFNLSERYCLTDSFNITFNTASNNPIWGFVSESVAIAASTPSATTYQGWVNAGTEIVIGSKVERWGFNLWRMTTTYVVAQ